MNLRLAAVAAIASFGVSACARSDGPLSSAPGSTAQTSATHLAQSLQLPALRLYDTPSPGAWPEFITAGPQHSMWFAEYIGRIGRIAMNGRITEFAVPDPNDAEGITIGADGNIWFTAPSSNAIGRMTPSGSFTMFSIPGYNTSPRGITLGPDGNVWYVEYDDGYIGRVTPQGTITRFAIPDGPNSSPWAITTGRRRQTVLHRID